MPQRIPNSQSAVIASLLILAGLFVGSSAWAYINGGDYHSTLKDWEQSLKAKGFFISVARPLPKDSSTTKEVAQDIKVDPADNPAFQTFVNELVGQAVQQLPQPVAEKLSVEDKREISRAAQESIRDAVLKQAVKIQKGELKSVRYQVGAVSFDSYWETNYGGKREIHAARHGIAPFIAIQPLTDTQPAKP